MTRAGYVAATLLAAATSLRAQEPPVFPSAVDSVRLEVSVTRAGVPVAALAATDFVVEDNGVLQDVQLVSHEESPVHAVLVLDHSSSLAGEGLPRLKAAAHAFLDALTPRDGVSLLTFSDFVTLRAEPGESRARAHAAIESAQARFTTSLYDAVFAALNVADPRIGRPLVLLFSDGQDVGSWLRPEDTLRVAARADLVAHVVVSQHEGSRVSFLEDLTAATGGHLWRADHAELEATFLRILEEFRSRYILRYYPEEGVRAGWHEVEVRVKRPGVQVRVREGYAR